MLSGTLSSFLSSVCLQLTSDPTPSLPPSRIVPILEPAPFSHSLNPSPYSSRSTSPVSTDDTPLPPLDSSTPERPSSLWRPPTSDSPVKVVHLGTTFEPHELSPKQNRKNGKGKGTKASHLRPPSTHSLKTLPRGAKGPSPLGLADDDGEGGEDDDEDDDDDDEDDEDGRYDTYRTAREGDTVVDRTQRGSSGGRGSSNGKTALRDLWSPEGTESEGTTAVDGEEEEGTTVTRTTGHEAVSFRPSLTLQEVMRLTLHGVSRSLTKLSRNWRIPWTPSL